MNKLIRRIISRAAIIIFVLFVSSSVVTLSVEAVRVKVFNWFLRESEKYTEVNVIVETGEDISGYYFPSYLPEGYKTADNQDLGTMRIIHFAKDDYVIEFIQSQNSSSFHLDTEDAEIVDIEINGIKGMLVDRGNKVTLFWTNNEMSFSIVGRINKEELIKIAENIEKK